MHRSLLALAHHASIASCNEEDPDALFADVRYQLRCLVGGTGTQPCETYEPAKISVQGSAGL